MEKTETPTNNSKFHQLNPLVKLLFTIVFIVFINLTPAKAWGAYALFFLYLITIISSAGLKFSDLAKRTIISLPFILAAIPLIFAGNSPYEVIPIFGSEIMISVEGWQKFLSITIKSILSILAALLLVSTSRPTEIFFALERLKIPSLFISIINLAYHYLFVIQDEVLRMTRARSSRSSSGLTKKSGGGGLMWRAMITGGMAGSILIRSIERSDRVYAAMLSRGYNGKTIPSIQDSKNINRSEYPTIIIGVFLVLIIWIYSLLIVG